MQLTRLIYFSNTGRIRPLVSYMDFSYRARLIVGSTTSTHWTGSVRVLLSITELSRGAVS